MDTSLSPIPSAAFGPAQARHLLLRTGFGAPSDGVAQAARLGLGRAVAQAVAPPQGDSGPPTLDLDPDVKRPMTPQQLGIRNRARKAGDQDTLDAIRKKRLAAQRQDRQMARQLRAWWLDQLITTPQPTREKLTLLWHGHFASSYRQVRDAYLMYRQNQMFRDQALAFDHLARGIVRDPAMILYLNNDRNRKGRPNENLARELMELFTLGEGNYTEADIKAGARALTGYNRRDNTFQFKAGEHDPHIKTILGQRGNLDGDAFVEILLGQPACSRFVAIKLYHHFVADVSDHYDQIDAEHRAVIDALAVDITASGYGLQPVLTRLFKSRAFYDPAVIGQKIKSPAELVVGTMRQVGAPPRDPQTLDGAMGIMGQRLFEPPSVAGWPVGREWINTSSLFARQNTCAYLLTGKRPGRKKHKAAAAYDPEPLLAGLDDRSPEAVADYLTDALLGPHTPAARRESLTAFARQRGNRVDKQSTIALLLLITATPEYQLC